MKNKKIRNDIILIGSVIILTLIILIVITLINKTGNEVIIEQNSKQVAVLDLNTDQEYNLYNGGKICNTVVIKDGEAYMIYADCKDKICVNHNKISKNNESIICLPNKVIVTVTNSKNNEVDGVAK